MRSRVRIRAVAAALVVPAVLASTVGCTSIPTSGEIRTNETAGVEQQDQVIRVLARPPRAGATPDEIVSGFLTASASFDDDHAVARSYLTSQASSTWVPDSRVAIYDADAGYRLGNFGESKIRMLGLRAAGSITARGQFRQPEPDSLLRADFGLAKVGGEWRIAAVQQGLILSTADVDRTYRTLNLYYLDVTRGVLVPDPIALAAGQPGLATALVRELLRGPTAWLAPAVSTAFPPGTQLALDSVPVEEGIARVDLDPRVVAATGDERRALAAQLTYTLTQLPDVTGVRITLSGVPFAVPGIGAVSTVSDWESFDPNAGPLDPNAYALDGGALTVLDLQPTPVEGWFGKQTTLTSAAVSPDGATLAGARREGGQSVVRVGGPGSERTEIGYRGTAVTSLSFDRLNTVWVADPSAPSGSLWTTRRSSPAGVIAVEGLGNRVVTVARVARDGARIALVVRERGDTPGTLLLGRLVRTSGRPTVGGLRRIESLLVDVVDLDWADDSTLLVTGRAASEPIQAYAVGIDGDSVRSAGSVPGMRSVAACPARPFLAGTNTSTLWIDRGNGWRQYARGQQPLYPG